MSGSALKLCALLLMVVDHVGEFFPGTPLALRWIGRLSAPIFLFCLSEGLRHTSNRQKFLLRLYLWGVGMAGGNLALNTLFPDAPVPVSNHIFSALFLFALCVFCLERGGRSIALLLSWQAVCCFVLLLGNRFWPALVPFVGDLLPSIFTVEGGAPLLLLGLVFYFLGAQREGLCAGLLLWSGTLFASAWADAGLAGAFERGYQWMGGFALPFLLCYNGRRGRGPKHFFYLFYPLHVYALFVLSNILML